MFILIAFVERNLLLYSYVLQPKKKMLHIETMPSPQARRIAPTISADLKKKIQTAIKSKENKSKHGVKKENIAEEVSVIFFNI